MIGEAEFVKRFTAHARMDVFDLTSAREDRAELDRPETVNFARAMYKLLFMQSEPEGTA